MTKRSPFRYFKASPETIRLAAMMYVRFPLSLLNVEDLLQWQTHLDHRIVTWDATGDVSMSYA
jgi:hypothetical protein